MILYHIIMIYHLYLFLYSKLYFNFPEFKTTVVAKSHLCTSNCCAVSDRVQRPNRQNSTSCWHPEDQTPMMRIIRDHPIPPTGKILLPKKLKVHHFPYIFPSISLNVHEFQWISHWPIDLNRGHIMLHPCNLELSPSQTLPALVHQGVNVDGSSCALQFGTTVQELLDTHLPQQLRCFTSCSMDTPAGGRPRLVRVCRLGGVKCFWGGNTKLLKDLHGFLCIFALSSKEKVKWGLIHWRCRTISGTKVPAAFWNQLKSMGHAFSTWWIAFNWPRNIQRSSQSMAMEHVDGKLSTTCTFLLMSGHSGMVFLVRIGSESDKDQWSEHARIYYRLDGSQKDDSLYFGPLLPERDFVPNGCNNSS